MSYNLPDEKGHFDQYGGIFVAETLMTAVTELKEAYEKFTEFIAVAEVCANFAARRYGHPHEFRGRTIRERDTGIAPPRRQPAAPALPSHRRARIARRH